MRKGTIKIIYGYARVSTAAQKEDRQVDELLMYGIPIKQIFTDKQSGKNFKRGRYVTLRRKLKKDDVLVVKSIDRLGRNYEDILNEWKHITKKIKADIVVLDMPLLDTRNAKDLLGTFIADLVLQLLSFVAENERANILRRQREGIAAAKKRGVRFGRPRRELSDEYIKNYKLWKNKKISAQEGADNSNMPLWAFYKYGSRIE